MLKTATYTMTHVRGFSAFSTQISSFQVLLLTMARGVIVLPGLLLMPHWDPKAHLSSVCLAKTIDVLQKHLPGSLCKRKSNSLPSS